MNQFDLISGNGTNGNLNGDYLAYTQFQQSDIPNYFSYASNFVLQPTTCSRRSPGPAFPTISTPSRRAICRRDQQSDDWPWSCLGM